MAVKEQEELFRSFCELQACDPTALNHEEREAFWLNAARYMLRLKL